MFNLISVCNIKQPCSQALPGEIDNSARKKKIDYIFI